jgi:hypothetical protein
VQIEQQGRQRLAELVFHRGGGVFDRPPECIRYQFGLKPAELLDDGV